MVKNFNNHLSEKIILPFLVLLTVIVRISGLKWGLPHLYHVDENRFAKIAIGYFSGDLNPHFFHVPSLHTYLIFISWKILFFFGKIIGRIPQGIKFKDWFEMNPTIPMLAGRFLVALFSIGTIILIYLIGKKIFNQRVGLFASIFLIFSLTHNRLSHSMVPVVPMIFFLVLSFYFIWLIYSKGNLKYYLLAGLFAGLAMATKYGGHLLFIPLFFAHLFSSLERRESLIKIFINFKLILFVLFFLIGFFIGTPYAFFDFSTFWRDFNWQARHLYEAGHYGTSTSQSALIFYLKYGFKRNIGILSQYFAFLGILLGIIRLKRKEIILFSLPLFLFFTIGNWKTYAVRYFLPAAPFFAIITAFAFDFIFKKLKTKLKFLRKKETFFLGIVFLILISPDIVKIYKFNYGLIKKDTRTVAKEWIEKFIPKGKKIALEMYCPPISREDYKVIYRHSLSQVSLEWLHRRKVEYIIVSDIMYKRFLEAPDEFPRHAKFYKSLEKNALLIKTFKPKWDDYLLDLHNPTIKIYRLSKYPDFHFPGNFKLYSQSIIFRKTSPNEWKIKTESFIGELINRDEKVRNFYIKILDENGEEIEKIIIYKDKIKSNLLFSHSFNTRNLFMNGKIKIGYEYYFSPPSLLIKPEGKLEKEYLLIEKIDKSIHTSKKFKIIYLYFKFPNKRGEDYFQFVKIIRIGNKVKLITRIYGGELTLGNDYVLNPWIKLKTLDGKEISKFIVFKGKIGSYESKRKAPINKSFRISFLPEEFILSLGYDYYFDKNFPHQSGGPEEYSFIFPLKNLRNYIEFQYASATEGN